MHEAEEIALPANVLDDQTCPCLRHRCSPYSAAAADRGRLTSPPACLRRTVLRMVPMPEIETSTTSPFSRKRGGSQPMPTPSGVPVAIASPGERVTLREMTSMRVGTSKIRFAVLEFWRGSPLTWPEML